MKVTMEVWFDIRCCIKKCRSSALSPKLREIHICVTRFYGIKYTNPIDKAGYPTEVASGKQPVGCYWPHAYYSDTLYNIVVVIFEI